MKALIAIFIGCVFLTSGCFRPSTQALKEPKTSKLAKLNSREDDKYEIDALLEDLRKKNPFRPDHSSGIISPEKGSIELKGIIWDPQKPYALIGEDVVMVGDYVGNKKVIRIDKKSVVLDNHGSEEVMQLEGTD